MTPVIIGDCALYLGDCRDFFAEFPCLKVDAVITDPPYGINYGGMLKGKGDGYGGGGIGMVGKTMALRHGMSAALRLNCSI